jgi:hypothetical protein
MGEVVRIEKELLEEVGKLLKNKDKRIKYVNKKHFVDLAVFELLKREEESDLNDKRQLNSIKRAKNG